MSPAKFFFRAVGFASIVLVLLLLCAWFGPNASRVDYHGAIGPKHERLGSLPSPKVIVIGGSNATFGIDSEVLENALCKPVVNMSLHASLGFRFMVDEVKGSLGPGDLIVVALEHSGYSEPDKDNDTHILTVDRYPEALDYLPWFTRPRVLMGVMLMRMQAVYKVWTGAWKDNSNDKVYRASGFNERGDIISHLGLPQRGPGSKERIPYIEPAVSEAFFPMAVELLDSASVHGAKVVFTWPSTARSSYRPERNVAIETLLKEHGIGFLGRDVEYVQEDTAFYDTHYHLRAAGRQYRTARLVRDLCSSGIVDCCSAKAVN